VLPCPTTPITPLRPTRDQVRHARHVLTHPDYANRISMIMHAWAVLRADHKARHGNRTAPAPTDGDAA
jgi:hypothetical protein